MKLNVGIELPIELVTESNAILGKKGSGKTTAGIDLIEEIYAAGVPFVSIDPKGDHYGLRASRVEGKPGLPVPVFGGLHGDIPLEPTAGTYLADLIRERGLSAVLDVSEFGVAERARFLTAFADRLYRFDSKAPLHLVLEEAHEYIPQFVGKEDARMVGVFERLVKLGRWKGIGVTMMSQRSASLNKNVLTQVDNLFVMRTTSPQDRAAVKLWIDTHADARDILDTLPSLQTGEAWLWQPSRGEPIRFRFRQRHTYDAGATPVIGEAPRAAATLADVDLDAISAAMGETIERAKGDDPKVLRARVAELEREVVRLGAELATAQEAKPEPIIERVEVSVLTDSDREFLSQQSTLLHQGVLDLMRTAIADVGVSAEKIATAAGAVTPAPARPGPRAVAPTRPQAVPQPRTVAAPKAENEGDVQLRTGARRMVETLGRMHPLRLTKSQWGTVSGLKTSGGTWSTYLSDIRRLGFIDENAAGYTLTEAGFAYLGGAPEPMTAAELQDHYRSILRAGAARMLDAIMAVYPGGIDRESLGEAIEISTAGGTFSTYLSDLTRNGLAEKRGGVIVATDILMLGAAA